MSMRLKPYPEYKDSGVPWLGKIPQHWSVVRLKQVAQVGPSKSEAKGLLEINMPATFLPMERIGTDGRLDTREMRPISEVWNGFTYFRRSDVLIAKITPCFENGKGACLTSLPTEVGFGSTEFIVLRAGPSIMPEFLYRVSTLSEFRALGADAMNGAAGQQRVPPDFVRGFICGLPSIEEQVSITRFLAHTDHCINRLIHAKRRLIELPNEQKLAIIHRAVTRGLDPNVRLKPSGIDWLGDLPEHWEVSRLKFLASHIVDCLHATPEYILDGEYPAIRTADVEPGRVRLERARRVAREHYLLWTSRLRPREGDVLYSREGERYGIAALVPPAVELCISQRMMLFRIREPQCSRYVMWQLNCPHVYAQASEDLIGATSPHVNVERIRNYALSVPPPSEQAEIVAWIEVQCRTIEDGRSKAVREINLLREYRTSLIADVVTGKLDVRSVELPVLDEAEALEDWETDEDAQADEMDEMEGVDA
jgi:type I restriction enzyme, S subunit